MNSTRVFETESIDLATFLATAGYEVSVHCSRMGARAVFTFQENGKLHEAIVAYERGTSLPAKKLLNVRSRLWREASQAVREGGGR
jgi:hypothetical protein